MRFFRAAGAPVDRIPNAPVLAAVQSEAGEGGNADYEAHEGDATVEQDHHVSDRLRLVDVLGIAGPRASLPTKAQIAKYEPSFRSPVTYSS